jgi:hypothetical protein
MSNHGSSDEPMLLVARLCRAVLPYFVGCFTLIRRGHMRFHTEYLTFNTKKHREYVHITPQIEAALKKSGVKDGVVLVSAMHITAGV